MDGWIDDYEDEEEEEKEVEVEEYDDDEEEEEEQRRSRRGTEKEQRTDGWVYGWDGLIGCEK